MVCLSAALKSVCVKTLKGVWNETNCCVHVLRPNQE
jgi:hypothetical protein